MSPFQKALGMLEAANAAYNDATARGDAASAERIKNELIAVLKSRLAGLALAELSAQAAILDALSGELEQVLRTLQGRIARWFLDPLVAKASELGLAAAPATAASASRIEPEARPAGRSAVGAPDPVGAGAVVIAITEDDLDALQRVAQSEVGHFAKYGDAQLCGGLAAVVDTVFNRTAHRSWPRTVQEVIDQPRQFSAVDAAGSWRALPPATPAVARIVEEHVSARAAGAASEIRGATHFLNPHLSSRPALDGWGRFVVANAIAMYGSEADKDVHYHGFAPGAALPPPYVIAHRARASSFDALGRTAEGPASSIDLRQSVVRICREELAFFKDGQAREDDDPQYKRVGEYWQVVGQPYDGRTVIEGRRPPWSAAFVCFVLKTARAGDRFPNSVAHCHYFQHFVDRSGPALYEALPATEVSPGVGDIIHRGRGEARSHDFAAARFDYGADSFYPSHSALVIEVDRDKGKLTAIGGNEGNSVRAATFQLDGQGRLKPYREGQKTYPWIGVLRLA